MSDRKTTLHEPERDSAFGTDTSKPSLHDFRTFRGLTVIEQLPTRGTEADLYLLEDSAGEKCVLKLYRHSMEPKPEVLERVREISRTRSDCLVVFRDAGFEETAGRWFELLEYLPLGSLKDVPVEIRREPDFIRKLISELAEAIHCLHENGIIHCDVKPGNVLVRSLDPLDLALTDFGIASPLNLDVSRRMTVLKGTPMYRPPEAFSRMAGRPGDWWGLGVIVLGLLTGEHPFTGLSEAQILHALTVGNVEVPEGLSDEWRSLLRGLLTKDDARRWGYAEIVRWLTGERASERHEPARVVRPFRFEGKDFSDPGDLARALCGNEEVWRRATKYANYFRPWLENNGLPEEAQRLGTTDDMDPDTALARFVYACSDGPFVWLGRFLDVDGLWRCLNHMVNREATEAARQVVALMASDGLLPLYELWAGLSGNDDPHMRSLLEITKGKPLAEQEIYVETLQNPESFLWPEDVSTQSRTDTLEALSRIQTLPLKRAFLTKQRASFVLPDALLHLFRRAESYAEGVRLLTGLRERELLIPQGSDKGFLYYPTEKLSLDDYEGRAHILSWGHTSDTLGKMDFIESELKRVLFDTPYRENQERGIARLNALREGKINDKDSFFLERLCSLLKARRRLPIYCMAASPFFAFVSAVALFCHPLMYAAACGIAALGLKACFGRLEALHADLRRGTEAAEATPGNRISAQGLWCLLFFPAALASVENSFRSLALLVACAPGGFLALSGYRYLRLENLRDIVSLCA